MNIIDYDFPKVSDVDLAFSTLATDKVLLNEAEKRGFLHGSTVYNELFSKLFFKGGKLSFKNDINKDFAEKALPYRKAFMGSFEAKHEHKEAICAMLLSEMVTG